MPTPKATPTAPPAQTADEAFPPIPDEPVYENVDEQGQPPAPATPTTTVQAIQSILDMAPVSQNIITAGLPEAGGVTWADVSIARQPNGSLSAKVGRLSITHRASDAPTSLIGFFQALTVLEKMGIAVEFEPATPSYTKTQPGPSPTPKQASQPATTHANLPQAPTQPANPGDVFRVQIEKLVINPVEVSPQGTCLKVQIEFYEANHRYADFRSWKMDIAKACEFLGTTGYEFTVAEVAVLTKTEFKISCGLVWKNSDQKNTKGNPYKNIVRLYDLAIGDV